MPKFTFKHLKLFIYVFVCLCVLFGINLEKIVFNIILIFGFYWLLAKIKVIIYLKVSAIIWGILLI